jgi:hypothetical protein
MSLLRLRRVRIALLRFALVTTVLPLGCISLIAQQPKVLAPHKPVPPRVAASTLNPSPSVPRSIAGGLWMTDGSIKSSLYLKNDVVASAIEVTPILYMANGVKLALKPVRLEPAGTATVSINDSLAENGIAPYAALSGYVEVQYQWPWDALCVTVRNIDMAHSLLFNYNLGFTQPGNPLLKKDPPKQQASQTIEGMWWKETAAVKGFLALSNTASEPLQATVTVSDHLAQTLATQTVTISSHGTKMLDLTELPATVGASGGLSITYTGPENAIWTTGGLEDLATGYSAVIPFTLPMSSPDPLSTHPTPISLAELGLMTGTADPMMSFPAGTTFTPYSLLRNTSSQPVPVQPSLYWMEGGSPRSAVLATFSVPPRQTATLDVTSMISRAGLRNFSGSMNLILDVPASSVRSLVMASGSVDQTKNYVFEVDPTGVGESTSRSLSYWSTANGDDTMISVWNPADEDQDFAITFFFSTGHYIYPWHLPARATRTFNVSEIIHSQISDVDGNVIPMSVGEGSALLSGSQSEAEHILVAWDAGTYNVRKAIRRGHWQNHPRSGHWAISHWQPVRSHGGKRLDDLK